MGGEKSLLSTGYFLKITISRNEMLRQSNGVVDLCSFSEG